MNNETTSETSSPFARNIKVPCYAVIFSSQRTNADDPGYADASDRMIASARQMPGFLGVETTRGADGFGITVSYWESEDAIRKWYSHPDHQIVQRLGQDSWYQHFELRVCRVERAYGKT